ncbi:MAG TPA: zf-HC2 domain-containing protein [Candidatus Rubrimentiphilum sp.]|nr:zf-HC2 domain-containing protein [Candidatus Rubrimentiphilum sp.]
MRCSSCEPLFDRYLEGTLTPREQNEVAAHVRSCGQCALLLEELKVVDALLFTTNAPELPVNFTFAVMAETRSMPAPVWREHRIWSFVALYVTAAWVAVIAAIAISGAKFSTIGAAAAGGASTVAHAIGAGFDGIGQGAPALATFGIGVLFIDFTLAAAVALLYFVVRPRLAAHLASAREVS